MSHGLPESPVLAATHILLIRIESANPGEWTPAPNGGVWRSVDLAVKLEEVLKGTTEEKPGDVAHAQVKQYGTGTTRIAGVPGVWSPLTLVPGLELVAYCVSSANRVAEMLDDPDCRQLLPADSALQGARLAVESEQSRVAAAGLPEAQNAALAQVLSGAEAVAPSLDAAFAEHLWATYGNAAIADPANFDLVMDLVERPDLAYPARATLLDQVYARVMASPIIPQALVDRLVLTMFRLLEVDQATPLRDTLVGVYLPNLVGVTGQRHTSAADVFQSHPNERVTAEQALSQYTGSSDTSALLAWLRG